MAIYFIESKYKEIFKLKQMLLTLHVQVIRNQILFIIIWSIQTNSIWTEAVLFQLLRVSVLME